MKKYLFLILAALGISACDSTQKSGKADAHHDMGTSHRANPKTKSLMDLHDSAMPNMEEIMTIKKQLTNIANQLDSQNVVNPSSQLQNQKKQASDLIQQLVKADKSMMDWMHQYRADTLETLDEHQQEAYIASQTAKMDLVNIQMQDVITKSKQFIKINIQ
ncbi:hypothetical protein L0657_05250 [Dyadobacter sp. CY345]|uniref:hypothetical protein n=1 Tax=Dyadobacter sp. CY345 TaxID=2909335 RepID=UPI001F1B4268|nr:hypothetical protein [Dyadobacter sp. CY345]MCF2443354.1 hypothetical protein [Dyadobacter sp. CY345]